MTNKIFAGDSITNQNAYFNKNNKYIFLNKLIASGVTNERYVTEDNVDENELYISKDVDNQANYFNSNTDLSLNIKIARNQIEPGQIYRHFKGRIMYLYDSKYVSQATTMREHREDQGYVITMKDVTSKEVLEIQSIIDETHGLTPIKYILIFGSTHDIPTYMKPIDEAYAETIFNATATTAGSDITYGHINGNYEIVVGRLSSGDPIYSNTYRELTNGEKIQYVENQVNKILAYEGQIDELQNNQASDYSWAKKIIGVASAEGSITYHHGGGIDGLGDHDFMRLEIKKYYDLDKGYSYTELFNNEMPQETEVIDASMDNDKEGNPADYDLVNAINEGSPLMLYAGHADEVSLSTTRFNIYDVVNLTNKDKYFLGCLVGCSVGSHDEKYISLAELFQVAPERGSIAIFGSTVLQTWQPPQHMMRKLNDEIIDAISEKKIKTIGDLFKSAVSVPVFSQPMNGLGRDPDFWFYHIFGDPATRYLPTEPNLYLS